jgi:hypothetical protein
VVFDTSGPTIKERDRENLSGELIVILEYSIHTVVIKKGKKLKGGVVVEK